MSKQTVFKMRACKCAVIALVIVTLVAADAFAQFGRGGGGRGGFGRGGGGGGRGGFGRGRGGRGGRGRGGGGFGGGNIINNNIGGIAIDAKGSLQHLGTRIDKDILKEWRGALAPQDGDIAKKAPMRKISLRGLQAAIEKHAATDGFKKPLPEEILFLGGLQRVEFVFVYPKKRDIVLAGPAEGWRIDDQGAVVGVTTGEPVLQLDDLLVALRVGQNAKEVISVSIDPTAEGVARFQKFVNSLRGVQNNPVAVSKEMERQIGPQQVKYTGVPTDSRMARVLIAADYRMKRYAMNLEKSPVRGLASYLGMASTAGPAMPRWWLTADYKALAKDADGLAWKLTSTSVKCETEDSIFRADGTSKGTGKSSKPAQRWADQMTSHYDELAKKDKTFAELRNTMDLALVGALIAEERLAEKAGLNLGLLMSDKRLPTIAYHIPTTISAKASLLKKSRGWLVSVSGGVTINPWKATRKTETDAQLAPVRAKVQYTTNNWWWN